MIPIIIKNLGNAEVNSVLSLHMKSKKIRALQPSKTCLSQILTLVH